MIIQQIENSDFKNQIDNFIDRFGKEGKNGHFAYRDYMFDWKRLEEFRDEAIKNKIDFSKKNLKEFISILKHYIDKKEKNYLSQSLGTKSSNNLNELNENGSDFEKLIVRLYDAMGYASKRVGGHGDQGGDVIANKNGENLLIQAKFYKSSVGNAAVQQAVAAKQYYGCTKAIVITTSYFTPEAITLAKSNFVELIDGDILRYKLSEYLHENWK